VKLIALPVRATCAVWESDGGGLIGDADAEDNAKTADFPVGGEAEIPVVTITNRAAPSPSPTPTDPTRRGNAMPKPIARRSRPTISAW
jgi:hypothetical protein